MGKDALIILHWTKWTQTIIWSISGVSKKMKEQQHAHAVKKISTESMGIAALKQHLYKLKTLRILSTFESVLQAMKVIQKEMLVLKKTQKQVSNLKGKLISQSYIRSSSKRAVQPPRKLLVKVPHLHF